MEICRALGLLWLAATASGCTYFEVRAGGSVPNLIANTMEWSDPTNALGWAVHTHPVGEQSVPLCAGGQSWTTKVAWAGLQNQQLENGTNTGNAMNEYGLTVSGHAFRGAMPFKPATITATICGTQIGEWAMSQFKSVAELRLGLATTAVVTTPNPTVSSPGFQWGFADAYDAVVLDYKDGKLRIHNNTVGVLTNDPAYEWHLSNLNNYAGLSNQWPNNGIVPEPTEAGTVPQVMGHGFNLLGLPGDLSPPSRFIRSFFMREYSMLAAPPKSLNDSIVLATGVLNSMHINKGYNSRAPGETGFDYTQFATLKVPAERLLYFRTYEDMQWRRLDLRAVDMSKHRVLRLTKQLEVRDVGHDEFE